MQKKEYVDTPDVFVEDVKMETETQFYENGVIVTTPVGFELENGINLIAGGKQSVCLKGSFRAWDYGKVVWRPYRKSVNPVPHHYYDGKWGYVQEYKSSAVLHLSVPMCEDKEALREILVKALQKTQEKVDALIQRERLEKAKRKTKRTKTNAKCHTPKGICK